MPIFVAYLIVAIACTAITYKTYVGYGNYLWYTKALFLLFTVFAWSVPIIVFSLKDNIANTFWAHSIKGLYFLFGFAFLLFMITFIRDFFWMIWDFIRKTPIEQIKNPPHLDKVNLITALFTLLLCIYGVYQAEKIPNVKTYDIHSTKINENTKLVMLSDLHIDTSVSKEYVSKIVNRVNELNPDVVVIVGDIIDASPDSIKEQIKTLSKLQPKKGTYLSFGNHEVYNGELDWLIAFSKKNLTVFANYGEKIGNTGIYLAGIPDINASAHGKMKVITESALFNASTDDYVIMLSHTPKVAKGLTKDNTDLILSGHTHGGQIFPFHFFTKRSNEGRLAGFYDVDGIKMYVSRGTRYWGPPMRIGAPSEITVFNFSPKK